MAHTGSLPLRWARPARYRQSPMLAHSRLRWYRDETATYHLTARIIVPALLRQCALLTVEGLHNVPLTGPVILAANHRDNLDPYLLLQLLPRVVYVAARPDGFGTGGLCGIWRRLGAFPGDAWDGVSAYRTPVRGASPGLDTLRQAGLFHTRASRRAAQPWRRGRDPSPDWCTAGAGSQARSATRVLMQ